MQNSTYNCPTCHAAVTVQSTTEPTIKCTFCGTVMRNMFYKEEASSGQIPMPVININVSQTNSAVHQSTPLPTQPLSQQSYGTPTQLPPQELYGTPMPKGQEVSPKSWSTTFVLLIFFGLLGGHRFYTGHILTGIIQFFTLGFGGIWTFIDFVLLITGNFHDSKGLKLRSSRISGRNALIAVGVLLVLCVAAYAIGSNASKVDLPAEQGWITGVERCVESDAFGELVLEDGINIWQDWGSDRGSIVGTVAHGTQVKMLEARRDTTDEITYYKIETPDGVRGWISEGFVQFQSLDGGPVPREDC